MAGRIFFLSHPERDIHDPATVCGTHSPGDKTGSPPCFRAPHASGSGDATNGGSAICRVFEAGSYHVRQVR
jgi:hypothetical protein